MLRHLGDPLQTSWQYIVQGKQDAVALNDCLAVCLSSPTQLSFSHDFGMTVEEVSCSLCSVCVCVCVCVCMLALRLFVLCLFPSLEEPVSVCVQVEE